MGLATVNIKNNPNAMDVFPPTEGLALIPQEFANVPYPIANLTGGDLNFGASGIMGTIIITGLAKGQYYYFKKGANTSLLVNSPTDITDSTKLGDFTALSASGSFQAKGASVVLVGTPSVAVDSLIVPEGICFQKLWMYPYNGFSVGIPDANTGSVYLGKSGILAATIYLPDQLANSGGPIVYQLATGQKMDFAQILISGGHNDGVFYSFT